MADLEMDLYLAMATILVQARIIWLLLHER
jgi:hypothetical protein